MIWMSSWWDYQEYFGQYRKLSLRHHAREYCICRAIQSLLVFQSRYNLKTSFHANTRDPTWSMRPTQPGFTVSFAQNRVVQPVSRSNHGYFYPLHGLDLWWSTLSAHCQKWNPVNRAKLFYRPLNESNQGHPSRYIHIDNRDFRIHRQLFHPIQNSGHLVERQRTTALFQIPFGSYCPSGHQSFDDDGVSSPD